jgi:hypothetical protein
MRNLRLVKIAQTLLIFLCDEECVADVIDEVSQPPACASA